MARLHYPLHKHRRICWPSLACTAL